MGEGKKTKDPQEDILQGHGAFGVDYVPKAKRARVENGKVLAGKVAEFSPGRARVVPLDRFSIALFRIGDEFNAIKDACPHADYPLSKGLLVSDYVVMCSSHNWRFDVRDGHCVKKGCGALPDHELSVRTFPVEIRGDEVWVEVL
jgi:nitrite reductase/ring-hydroxylating ferredoxin subunit